MVVYSVLFGFFLAITVCTLACGAYIVAGKVYGSRDRLTIRGTWARWYGHASRGNNDEESNVLRPEGPPARQSRA